jgi:hypothetical protein
MACMSGSLIAKANGNFNMISPKRFMLCIAVVPVADGQDEKVAVVALEQLDPSKIRKTDKTARFVHECVSRLAKDDLLPMDRHAHW